MPGRHRATVRPLAAFALSLLFLPLSIHAWGAVGHETVATIAQIHLHPSAKLALASVLPPYANGHLAGIATWADRIRMIPAYRFSGELHYTSPLEDYPPKACFFGERGWKTDHDVLHAIANYTTRLQENPTDLDSLRFLVHFIGDVHQPLHLTNRERGGNGDPVIFEGRRMSLHGLWDGGLITKAIREQRNYTSPLPSSQIENALRGTIYDPYIRLILWEGVRSWWRTSLAAWFSCPHPLSPESLASPSQQLIFATSSTVDPSSVESTVCPEAWARETHVVTCGMVFPVDYDFEAPAKEVNTKDYYGPIRDNNVIEKLLAQGGLRLAATLNSIFASPEELTMGFVAGWMDEADLAVEQGL